MYGNLRVAAIIAAAGTGSRMGGDIPKQFVRLDGKTILERTVEAFDSNASIDDILIVADKDRIEYCKDIFARCGAGREFGANSRATKIRAIVPGGASRQESVGAGLAALPEKVEIVLIHDAARPFVSQACIGRVVRTAAETGAAVAAVPVHDTIKTVRDGRLAATLDRDSLYVAQTPQGFRRALIADAYESAFSGGFVGTDDAVLAERSGAEVFFVEGDANNFKITVPDDIIRAEAVIRKIGSGSMGIGHGSADEANFRIGAGFDAHRFAEGRPLVLAGARIPHDRGLLGHSDADVLTHALMDALLGAAALGDIGKLFPDTDPAYKGISSIKLLEEVAGRLEAEGWKTANADITAIAETPQLARYVEQMRENLAGAMKVPISAVSVKATTTEGMGFAGRKEGIAAHATALVRKF